MREMKKRQFQSKLRIRAKLEAKKRQAGVKAKEKPKPTLPDPGNIKENPMRAHKRK